MRLNDRKWSFGSFFFELGYDSFKLYVTTRRLGEDKHVNQSTQDCHVVSVCCLVMINVWYLRAFLCDLFWKLLWNLSYIKANNLQALQRVIRPCHSMVSCLQSWDNLPVHWQHTFVDARRDPYSSISLGCGVTKGWCNCWSVFIVYWSVIVGVLQSRKKQMCILKLILCV